MNRMGIPLYLAVSRIEASCFLRHQKKHGCSTEVSGCVGRQHMERR